MRRLTGNVAQETVFRTEHPGWSDDGSLREGISDSPFTLPFCSVKIRGRVRSSVHVGHMHQSRDVGRGRDLSNELSGSERSASRLTGFGPMWTYLTLTSSYLKFLFDQLHLPRSRHRHSPGLPIPTSQVVNRIRMLDTFVNLVRVPSVPFLFFSYSPSYPFTCTHQRHDLSQITHDLQMSL